MNIRKNIFSKILISLFVMILIALNLDLFGVSVITNQSFFNVLQYFSVFFVILYLCLNVVRMLLIKFIGNNFVLIVIEITTILLPLLINQFLKNVLPMSANILGLAIIYVIAIYIYFGREISFARKGK